MSNRNKGVVTWSRAVCVMCGLVAGGAACSGNGGSDDKFAAQTFDEYTEPLTNAVIGTPDSVITVGPDGSTKTQPAASPNKKNDPPAVGAGGAAGAGGATGTAGAAGSGTGGSVIGTGGTAGAGTAGTSPFGGSAGSFAGSAGAAGSGGGFGQWHFDDCSPNSHFLIDSSGFGANAQQALKASCVPGISGLGVQIRSAKDVIQVPDEPQFTIDQHIGVAAWVNPNKVSGDQPIVLKRLNNKTAFSLGIHNGNIEMSVVLTSGKTVISRAPINPHVWTHVAGMFDGTFVFLFINGQQFGQTFGAGTVRDVFAPLRIGATTGSQFLDGTVDEVFVTTNVIDSTTLTSLSCITKPTTLSVSPEHGGPVPPDTAVHYEVGVQDNDVGACGAKSVDMFLQSDPGISEVFDGRGSFQTVNPGQTATFGIDVTGSTDADPGLHFLPFFAQVFGGPPNFPFEFLNGQLNFEMSPPTGCFVSTRRELMITSPSVVDDPVRAAGTSDPLFGGGGGGSGAGGEAGASDGVGGSAGTVGSAGSGTAGAGTAGGGGIGAGGSGGGGGSQVAGVWSFGHLMREMAPTPEQAPAFTLALFQHWLTPQTINGFTIAPRPAMQNQLLDIWPKTASGELDLDRSPLSLQAIVNRVDIRNLAENSAGEGRLVYGVNGPINFQQFTVIVEYKLPANSQQDVLDWANRWHALGSHPFPSEEYNAALEAVTRRFTDRGALPSGINGSALVELRTNEIALAPDGRWQLRSFELAPSGFLEGTTVKETPDLGFNGSSTFAAFVNQNAAAIKQVRPGDDAHTVPLSFAGAPFRGAAVFNDLIQWSAPGIADPDARFHASMNTCNGCHGPETNTGFLMVTPRFPGSEASLSPFITGTTVFDFFSGQTRTLNDLGRRKTDLTTLVCQ